MLRRLVVGLALATLVAGVGCTRGKKKAPAEESKKADAAAAVTTADPHWDRGELPPGANEGTPVPGGTLVVRLQAEPPSLDRLTDSDLISTWILERKVYESLAEADASKHPDYPLKPLLAESWETSPDGLTITFRIRKGVTWHDGRPFSGQDVVATVKKILDPKVRSMHLRNQFDDLEDIRTLPGDDFTVVAKYRKPYFLALRSLATTVIYPKHLLDAGGDLLQAPIHRAPVGTGPFAFESWKTADRITFVRNEKYWGRKAYLDRVIYRLVQDHGVAFQLLQKGEFDLHTALQPAQWAKEMPEIDSMKRDYNRIKFFDPNYSWIGWNQQRPFFKDRRVRQAMTLLMDRENMLKSFLLGIDRPTTCIFYADSQNCDPSLKPLPYDPAKAKALLDESGWIDHDGDGLRDKDGVPFRFTFLLSAGSPFGSKLAPYLQQELKKYGIEMDVKKVEWSIYAQSLREHAFDVCFLAWGNNDVVTDPYQIWHSSQNQSGSNYISYANPEIDRLIERARTELDDAKRAELYREFGRVLYEDQPYTFLFIRPRIDAVRRNVRGVRPSVTWYDLEDVWLAPAAEAGAR